MDTDDVAWASMVSDIRDSNKVGLSNGHLRLPKKGCRIAFEQPSNPCTIHACKLEPDRSAHPGQKWPLPSWHLLACEHEFTQPALVERCQRPQIPPVKIGKEPSWKWTSEGF